MSTRCTPFEQHGTFRFVLERLRRSMCVVLRQMEKAERAKEPRAVSLPHVAKPGPIWMVLVDEKEAVIVAQLTYKRTRVRQPGAERLLTNDVHSQPARLGDNARGAARAASRCRQNQATRLALARNR